MIMAGGGMSEEMKGTMESKEWYVAAYAPQGVPTSDHLKLRTVSVAVDSVPDNHVALEVVFISIDPYLRARFYGRDDGLFAPQFSINEVISTFGIGRVIKSRDDRYQEGDFIIHPSLPIAEYCIAATDFIIRKVNPASGVPLTDYLSALGAPGFAAWCGLVEVGELKEGSNVFISAAAGGVGMFAGQLAKLKGCRVIGSTGSDEKVKLVKEEFGYDDAFKYKTETDVNAALSKHFPDGIDLYLDNVGGKMLEAVLNHVNHRARIPVCGMISGYNKVHNPQISFINQNFHTYEFSRPVAGLDRARRCEKLVNIVGKEVRMEGYMVGSFFHRFRDFEKEMVDYLVQGKIRSKHNMYVGIVSFVESLGSVFSSGNDGKVILQLKKY